MSANEIAEYLHPAERKIDGHVSRNEIPHIRKND
jgi:hypothetical protein